MMRRNLWFNDPKNFERLRQNFTTSLCVHGPNMTLPQMSERLCEIRSEVERLRAAGRRALEYLEGEAPGVTSGGIRNSDLRDELTALCESNKEDE